MKPALQLVPDDAAALLDLLAPGEPVTFQTFGEGVHKGDRTLTRTLHGTLSQHRATLIELNRRGAGVFWTVNTTNGTGRKARDVVRVRALFVDLDGAPLEPVQTAPLRPHCIVESSPARWHAYWRIADCPLGSFLTLQKALATRFQADASVCDLPRVMRLPGFLHRKGTVFASHIVALCDTRPCTLAEVVEAFELSSPEPGETRTKARRVLPGQIPEGKRNETLLSLAGGLVRKGHNLGAVTDRLQRINAERCEPPLCASEVDEIAKRAVNYGSDGFALLPHKLLDSRAWRALTPRAHDVILTAFRRYDGSNNGNIALTWEDFEGRPGFGGRNAFYGKHGARRAVIESGILELCSEGTNSQRGRKADLFRIADAWLPVSPGPKNVPGPNP